MSEIIESSLPQLRLLLYIGLALLLGGVIGWEREEAEKPAGLRTHMLVCAAAALLVGLGEILTEEFRRDIFGDLVRTDPTRLLEAIITGVSFLGAGTIIRQRGRGSVAGLTTAASLLMTSGIGAAIALHQFVLAAGATVATFVTLRFVWKARA
jgi:putative Mg2+ transporter-C (MgtC) family protein